MANSANNSRLSSAEEHSRTTAEDYLRDGIAASQSGDSETALDCLQRSVQMQHDNAFGHYLLGAELAAARRYGDAVVHFSLAVEQAPELWPARLQLGLLWLTLKNAGATRDVLAPLLGLSNDDATHHFGAGIIALSRDQLTEAADALSRGLALGHSNGALVHDMELLKSRIEAERAQATLAEATTATPQTAQASEAELSDAMRHGLALSAYGFSGKGKS